MFTKGPDDRIDVVVISEGSSPKADAASRASDLVRSVSLGDASSALGRPDLVFLSHYLSTTGYFMANYLGNDVKVTVTMHLNKKPTDLDQVQPGTSVSKLSLSRLVDCTAAPALNFAPWAGFTTIGRYRATQNIQRSVILTSMADFVFCR
jgi:hypothetical protein